ncbi:unnamed protein product [Gongylonema pulchrum]|uniref:Dolichyl-phosphate beta-glucosyltransferase n=1 Tax=Gongylonema pulchrum TaxID=637853 RepID=A0A183DWD9_9BILA|nr:unnamed protein product [Gongylonema pulchrum]
MDLITLLEFILYAIAAGVVSLCLLSWFTPWPVRTRSELQQAMFIYNPEISSSEQFQSLLLGGSFGQLQSTDPDLYLSVVVPAMNEAKRLPAMLDECLPYLERRQAADPLFTYEASFSKHLSRSFSCIACEGKHGSVYFCYVFSAYICYVLLQIIVVDDGSGAVRSGVLCARGALILFADADGATKFWDFDRVEGELLSLIAPNNHLTRDLSKLNWLSQAIAVGSRAHMEKESIATRSLARTLLMIGFHCMVYIFAVRTVRDTQCGFKLFTRGAAAKLFPLLHIERWAFDVELLFLAEHFCIPIAEVAVTWHEVDGSKIVPVLSWIQMGRDLILIWFRYATALWSYDLL